MSEDRRNRILSLIRQKRGVCLSELKTIFPGLSEMTLRRDLDALANAGYVTRVRGGAVLPDAAAGFDYADRSGINTAVKNSIGIKAVSLLEENRSIYLDAGTTMMAFAGQIPDMHLFVITNAPNIGLEVARRENTDVIFLGGSLSKATVSISGPVALGHLDNLNIDLAFIATGGYSVESGFTNPYIYECELKRKVIRSAKKVIVLMDHSKLQRRLPYTFADLGDIDVIVTDRALPDEIRAAADAAGVQVVF